MKIQFHDGKVVYTDIPLHLICSDDDGMVTVCWAQYRIRYSMADKLLIVMEVRNGVQYLLYRQRLKKSALSGTLMLNRNVEFHSERFTDWCEEHHITMVRSKKPNHFYPMAGDLETDGTITVITNDNGTESRSVSDATYVIHQKNYGRVLYTKKSIYKLAIG